MKALITILMTLLTVSAHAAESHEIENTTAFAISVQNFLYCRVQVNETTILGERGLPLNDIIKDVELHLDHDVFSSSGCDQTAIKKIVENSFMSFGHVLDAPVTVEKIRSESRINGFGQCVANYTEIVQIDLGEFVVVKSKKGQLIFADDCQ